MPNTKDLYSTAQAAEYLGKSVITIKRAVASGALQGTPINPRMWVFTKAQLDAYASVKRKPGPKPGKGKTHAT